MNENTPTVAPKFNSDSVVATPIKTEVKTTQATTFSKAFATADFELVFHYSTSQYKVGDEISVSKFKEGYTMLDGYGCHLFEEIIINGVKTKTFYIPNELIKERQFTIVREYKTTVWEIL